VFKQKFEGKKMFKVTKKSLVCCVVMVTVGLVACSGGGGTDAQPKNVIFFLGDGMGMTTMTAARIYSVGEDGELTMDTLPETGFVKTFSNDAQVTDSAPSMSAYMTGVKMNNEVVSMSAVTQAYNTTGVAYTSGRDSTCPSSGNGARVPTVLELAIANGMSTGVVTTARLTHATPAAAYAHICNRNGENDIASQAVPGNKNFNSALGSGVDVLLGGDSTYWRPVGAVPAAPTLGRTDKADLVKDMQGAGYSFVSDVTGLNSFTPGANKKLFGLFDQAVAQGHMSYEADRNPALEPSIAQMTTKAIDVLSQNKKGYFLMVEGGRIDHALHETNGKRALIDTVAFDDAIKAAIAKVDLKNTLIVVTADHDHTLVLNGYAKRTGKTTSSEAGILGLVKDYVLGGITKDIAGLGYSILGFGNGENRPATRAALTDVQISDLNYRQEAVIQTSVGGETHGGADVFIGAIGSGAQSIGGVMDNTAVFSLLKSGLGL
jgi:alkaline phosphatase